MKNKLLKEMNEKNHIQENKQNLPMKINCQKDRKFAYFHSNTEFVQFQQLKHKQVNRYQTNDKQVSIEQVKVQLAKEKQKVKLMSQKMISDQMDVLQKLEFLEKKFSDLSIEKDRLERQLNRKQTRINNKNDIEIKYQNLECEHRKIKGITSALICMMKNVEGYEGTLQQAWKWVKKVVRERQTIRKKASHWKQAYDKMHKNMNSELSICSNQSQFDETWQKI